MVSCKKLGVPLNRLHSYMYSQRVRLANPCPWMLVREHFIFLGLSGSSATLTTASSVDFLLVLGRELLVSLLASQYTVLTFLHWFFCLNSKHQTASQGLALFNLHTSLSDVIQPHGAFKYHFGGELMALKSFSLATTPDSCI